MFNIIVLLIKNCKGNRLLPSQRETNGKSCAEDDMGKIHSMMAESGFGVHTKDALHAPSMKN